MIGFAAFGGSNFLGIYAAASDTVAIVPRNTPDREISRIGEMLKCGVIRTSIGGTSLIGSLLALNSTGAVTTGFIQEAELSLLGKSLNVVILEDRCNAAGNNIVMNDRGAIVNPDMGNRAVRSIAETLGIEVVKGTVASMKTVGSACIANNTGALCHPDVLDSELELIQEVLRVKANIGTANYGIPLVGACILANSKGALTGSTTTPVEVGRIEEALNI